ncbi:unnamed protein product [Lota lota]
MVRVRKVGESTLDTQGLYRDLGSRRRLGKMPRGLLPQHRIHEEHHRVQERNLLEMEGVGQFNVRMV